MLEIGILLAKAFEFLTIRTMEILGNSKFFTVASKNVLLVVMDKSKLSLLKCNSHLNTCGILQYSLS